MLLDRSFCGFVFVNASREASIYSVQQYLQFGCLYNYRVQMKNCSASTLYTQPELISN